MGTETHCLTTPTWPEDLQSRATSFAESIKPGSETHVVSRAWLRTWTSASRTRRPLWPYTRRSFAAIRPRSSYLGTLSAPRSALLCQPQRTIATTEWFSRRRTSKSTTKICLGSSMCWKSWRRSHPTSSLLLPTLRSSSIYRTGSTTAIG